MSKTILSDEPADFLNQKLARMIMRVRFTGEDDLYRMLQVVQNFVQTIRILEKERCSLICCKTSCETDCQDSGFKISLVFLISAAEALERINWSLSF